MACEEASISQTTMNLSVSLYGRRENQTRISQSPRDNPYTSKRGCLNILSDFHVLLTIGVANDKDHPIFVYLALGH